MSAAAKSLVSQALTLAQAEVAVRQAAVEAAEASGPASLLASRRSDLALAAGTLSAVRSADRSIYYLSS